jgi:zinc protease
VLVVVYSIGNDHDQDGQSGLGHMVEHVYVTAAAGDRKPRTAQEFASHYPQGANGQTGDRYTVFSTVFPRQDLEVELREAADRMGNLHITTADVDRERPRILEETENMFGSIPTLGAQNHARELIRSTPKGGRRGGQPAQIQALTVENLRDQWQRFYKPRNAIIAVSGALDAAAARKLITTHFGGLAPGTLIPSPAAPDAPHFGVHREFTVKPADPDALPMACLAYATPAPGSDLYAPFLVLIMRLWVSSAKLGNGPMGSQMYFTPLDDGAIVGISSPLKPGESVPKTIARLEAFVNETIAPELTDPERVAARQQLGLLLGFADVPDPVLGRNPYGVAFSLARRVQLGLDSAQLDRALSTITDQDLRRAADAVFAPSKHSGAFILLEK